MDLGVAPGHQLAVEPDQAVAVVEGKHAPWRQPCHRPDVGRVTWWLLDANIRMRIYVNMADVKSPAWLTTQPAVPARGGAAPGHRAAVLRLSRLHRRARCDARHIRLRPGPSPRHLLRRPQPRHHRGASCWPSCASPSRACRRVLSQLVRQGFIDPAAGHARPAPAAARLTDKGAELERRAVGERSAQRVARGLSRGRRRGGRGLPRGAARHHQRRATRPKFTAVAAPARRR